MDDWHRFLPARRCASAVLVVACLSVCLSITSHSSIKTAKRIELVFGTEATLNLSFIVLKN